MPAVTRLGDLCTGHGPCPPRPSNSASSTVFANGIPVHRLGDSWSIHCLHGSVLAAGSSTVFSETKNLGRIGDPVACGSKVMQGSGTVFAGG
tara:strand:+ start:6851 stop:7126 length:276 start_codon:yes stop_codon:yes gene_type:complete